MQSPATVVLVFYNILTSFLGARLSPRNHLQPEGNLTWPDVYFSPEVQKGPPPSLPCLIFVISYFICFYLPCLILPSFPPPCAGVVKRAGLGERLKSHREYLIRNSKASSAHLGRARRRRAAKACASTETPGRAKRGQRLAGKRECNSGSWRASSAIIHCSVLFHVLPSLHLSWCVTGPPHPPPHASVFACWWRRGKRCGRKWRAKCHFIAPICTPMIALVPRLTPARFPYQSFSHKSPFQISRFVSLMAMLTQRSYIIP